MPLWRIRVILPDDPHSHQAFKDAISSFPTTVVRVESLHLNTTEMTGDVVVELRDDEPLGDMLHALHDISPQVFVSRANPADAAAVRQPLRLRQFSHRLGAYS